MKYRIMGKYLIMKNHPAEEIDTADNRKDAEYLLNEYRIDFGKAWKLWIEKA